MRAAQDGLDVTVMTNTSFALSDGTSEPSEEMENQVKV